MLSLCAHEASFTHLALESAAHISSAVFHQDEALSEGSMSHVKSDPYATEVYLGRQTRSGSVGGFLPAPEIKHPIEKET
jgi:hypothetical protein